VVISVLRTHHHSLDARDDYIGRIGLRQRCCAEPNPQTKYTLQFALDPGDRWRRWLLDVGDALVFVEVQQQEIPVEPVVNATVTAPLGFQWRTCRRSRLGGGVDAEITGAAVALTIRAS
jgi:hypothetical protein